jgi:hypothetical protein
MALSVTEKPEVGDQPYVTCTKVVEQFSTPVSILNNIMVNKKSILQQCVTTQPARKKIVVKAKMGITYANSGSNVKVDAEETALKINNEFTPLNGWFDQFRKSAGLS